MDEAKPVLGLRCRMEERGLAGVWTKEIGLVMGEEEKAGRVWVKRRLVGRGGHDYFRSV